MFHPIIRPSSSRTNTKDLKEGNVKMKGLCLKCIARTHFFWNLCIAISPRVLVLLINTKTLMFKNIYKIIRIVQIGLSSSLLILMMMWVVSKHIEFGLFQDINSYVVLALTQYCSI